MIGRISIVIDLMVLHNTISNVRRGKVNRCMTLGYVLKGDSAAKGSEVIGPVLLAVVFLFPLHSLPPVVLHSVL